MLKEALYYEKVSDSKVHCRLCPQECLIAPGKRGICGVRINMDGALYSEVYGEITAIALDPIEKKPLYHYHKGEHILSVSTKGCNFRCSFCQNWHISQDLSAPTESISTEEIIAQAKRAGSFGIAYTYNEPFVWYEFVLDCAKRAKISGLENVLVTNAYINKGPLEEIIPYIGAMNIDLKFIDDKHYKEVCSGRVQPVLDNIVYCAKSGVHVELTNLIVPGLNDTKKDISKLVDWVYDSVGPDMPVHFSKYFPCYKSERPSTPASTMEMARGIALKKLKYVYLGNM